MMKKIEIELPEGFCAKWDGGILRLVDERSSNILDNAVPEGDAVDFGSAEARNGYMFSVGDKVKCANGSGGAYTVRHCYMANGEFAYTLENEYGVIQALETDLDFLDITDVIKSFDDARRWCLDNHRTDMAIEYDVIEGSVCEISPDILAYLQLRIITAALNEGWDPTFGKYEMLWCVEYDCTDNICEVSYHSDWVTSSVKLAFKSNKLAEYAATQFRDIYAVFCRQEKGGGS